MAAISQPQPTSKLQAIDNLANQSEIGYAATIVTRVLAPKIERRLALLLDHFERVPPDLPSMLDLRAQIMEVWRIKKELDLAKSDGNRAVTALENIVSGSIINSNPQQRKEG